MEIRPLGPEDEERSAYLGRQAFAYGERDLSRAAARKSHPHDAFGIFDEGGLQARVVVQHYHCYLGDKVVAPIGGIAGVTCAPDRRGRGYATAGMKHALELMRDSGQYISTLFPFSWDYYRTLGYEWVGMERRYGVPSRVLKPHPEADEVRAIEPDDLDGVRQAYTRFSKRLRGMFVRSDDQWAAIMDDKEDRHTYRFQYDGKTGAEGYLVYRGGSGDEIFLREFVANTPAAWGALLGFLRRLNMNTQQFGWRAAGNDALFSHLVDWDISAKLGPKCMGRVVDVKAALTAWRPCPDARGELRLRVADTCAPWNDGVWAIEFEAGQVRVDSCTGAADVSTDIGGLSQAYFGTPTTAEVRASGRLQVECEKGYEALAALLNGPPMWMNEDF